MQGFQDAGEPIRRALGIDGTAGDAQDVDHPYTSASPDGPCLACGLARTWWRHIDRPIGERTRRIREQQAEYQRLAAERTRLIVEHGVDHRDLIEPIPPRGEPT